MNISQIFPTQNNYYTWFFYLGVIFFVNHILLNGFGLNLSYFGLILIYIGLRKPVLSNWFFYLLCVFILLDIYSNIRQMQDKMAKRMKKTNVKKVKFDKNVKEGITVKNSDGNKKDGNKKDGNKKSK